MSAALAIGLVSALALSSRLTRGSADRLSSPAGVADYTVDWGTYFAGARRLSRLFDENVRSTIENDRTRSWGSVESVLEGNRRILIIDWMESSARGFGRSLLSDLIRIAKDNKATGVLAISKAVDGFASPLGFYQRMGFKVVHSHPEIDASDMAFIWLSLPSPDSTGSVQGSLSQREIGAPSAERNDRGSRSVFLDENSKTRIQAVHNQSFTRSAVLSPAEASRKALSELRSMGGEHRPPEAVDALRVVSAGHKKILWIDLVKINDEQKGRGRGSAAARRMEAWAQAQGVTLALAVSYDFTGTGSPLPFWEKLGYSSIYEDEDVVGQPAIIFKELKNG